MTETTTTNQQIPEQLAAIKADRSKALRAPKEREGGNPPGVEDARTAARYIGDRDGVPVFEVVTTKVYGFPEGKDMRDEHTQTSVANWVRAQDPAVIDAAEEDWDHE